MLQSTFSSISVVHKNMHHRLSTKTILTGLAVLLALLNITCGHSNVTTVLDAEGHFALGKKRFLDRDYLEAQSEFEVIRLQYPGSIIADSAQYYLGECHYYQDEFLLAAEEYQTLRRNMPASTLLPLAQYKIAMCYYNLSPKSSLDQSYTKRAIDEFQAFIEYYPTNELVKSAEDKIAELNTRLAKKIFESGVLYMKLNDYTAAAIYFNLVIEKYHDTPYAELAQLNKVKALMARRKYAEAKTELEKYFEKYPSTANRGDADALQKDIDEHLRSNSAVIDYARLTGKQLS